MQLVGVGCLTDPFFDVALIGMEIEATVVLYGSDMFFKSCSECMAFIANTHQDSSKYGQQTANTTHAFSTTQESMERVKLQRKENIYRHPGKILHILRQQNILLNEAHVNIYNAVFITTKPFTSPDPPLLFAVHSICNTQYLSGTTSVHNTCRQHM
jgi:hypothetical protein